MRYAQVAIPKALPRPLIYLVPEGLCDRLKTGHRVCVPLGSRQSVGYVVGIATAPPARFASELARPPASALAQPWRAGVAGGSGPRNDAFKIKEVTEILDGEPVFTETMLELISWMASYYLAPIGEVCRTALPPRLCELKGPKLTRPTSPLETWTPSNKQEDLKLNEGQRHALETILANLKLIHGIAAPATNPFDSHPVHPEPVERGTDTRSGQAWRARNDSFKPVLLHGITGSGKTEIYLRTFEEIRKTGVQGLLLTPEISLTPQLVQRFRDRFGDKVAVYHSGLTEAQRLDQWERMRSGELFAAVGTRSALFAPFKNLKAIVVDEEHDSSYKQEEGFLYNARDAAVMRAKLEGAVVILGSATPSVESFWNAKSGKYLYCYLPERATGAMLPKIEIVDLRQNHPHDVRDKNVPPIGGTDIGGTDIGGTDRRGFPTPPNAGRGDPSISLRTCFSRPTTGRTNPPLPQGSLADAMIEAIQKSLSKKEQVLLFLNRRGFANFLLCKACGHVFECPNCDIALTHHQPPKLLCHYCDYSIAPPHTCPTCHGFDIIPMGKGTQRLEEELLRLFPTAKIARLDRDTTAKVATRKTFLAKMQKGEIDILVGTQLIAKGHDFPNVTLVGVVDADVALHLPDFRAFERTFQILTQVAGRAGRADKPGRVIIQTYQPDHPSLVHAKDHDYNAFFEKEHEHRKVLKYPPFSRVANMRFSANSLEVTEKAAEIALKILKNKRKICNLEKQVALLGPAPAPLKKVRGKFRYQLLIKAPNASSLATLLNTAIPAVNAATPSGCRTTVDVDPINML